MIQPDLEERVAKLEQAVIRMIDRTGTVALKKDWRSTLGMFADDSVMRDIDQEGRKIREADRRQAIT